MNQEESKLEAKLKLIKSITYLVSYHTDVVGMQWCPHPLWWSLDTVLVCLLYKSRGLHI